jgi:hypothetical protein
MKLLLIATAIVATATSLLPPTADADGKGKNPRELAKESVARCVEEHRVALARLDAAYREAVRAERNRHTKDLSTQLDGALQREDLETAMLISEHLSRATAALDSARIVHPAGAGPQGIRVLAAQWGMGTRWRDVTERVEGYFGKAGIDVLVNHRSFGDPAPRWKKTLFVAYEKAGELKVKVVAEDRRLRLP